MFHKIKSVSAISDYMLNVKFCDGTTKLYDIKPLFDKIPVFRQLLNQHIFDDVSVDVGGYGIVWNDELDLSCDELWDNGTAI